MKVRIVNRVKDFGEEKLKVIQSFTKFAQNNSPLKKDVEIVLMDQRLGKMSTGSEIPGLIKILAKDRMLLDVLRTVAHEWTHEFARQRNVKLQGFNTQSQEDYANTEAGIMVRMFESQNPQFVALLYNL
jgi:hypothetical protein